MFEPLTSAADRGRRPWTVALSFVLQCAAVAVMVLVPMVFTDAIPGARAMTIALFPPLKGAPDAPSTRRSAPAVRQQHSPTAFESPTRIPARIDSTPDAPMSTEETPPGDLIGGPWVRGNSTLAVSSVMALSNTVVVPPPPPAVKREKPAPQRVGGDVQQAKLISQQRPVYPQIARSAGISGAVRLTAFISEQGAIEQLRVISGHPMLIRAALDAVIQWRYRPTILNGEPVRVETTIDIHFNLARESGNREPASGVYWP